MSAESKLNMLKELLAGMGSVAIGFSSGVDSTFLLQVAHEVLEERVLAITIKSSFTSEDEWIDALAFVEKNNIQHDVIHVDLNNIQNFTANPINRCYVCKKHLFYLLKEKAKKKGITYILDGTNKDDLSDYRPGYQALKELEVRSPLLEVGLTKEDIRYLSKEMGLATWEKPAFACLASRIPYGEAIDEAKLGRIQNCESYLFSMGFKQLRVRCHNELARIEVLPEDRFRFLEQGLMETITSKFQEYGFKYVTLDLIGYRCGSLNEGIIR